MDESKFEAMRIAILQLVTQPRDPGRSFGESVRLSFCC